MRGYDLYKEVEAMGLVAIKYWLQYFLACVDMAREGLTDSKDRPDFPHAEWTMAQLERAFLATPTFERIEMYQGRIGTESEHGISAASQRQNLEQGPRAAASSAIHDHLEAHHSQLLELDKLASELRERLSSHVLRPQGPTNQNKIAGVDSHPVGLCNRIGTCGDIARSAADILRDILDRLEI